jgi:hypothetical protein
MITSHPVSFLQKKKSFTYFRILDLKLFFCFLYFQILDIEGDQSFATLWPSNGPSNNAIVQSMVIDDSEPAKDIIGIDSHHSTVKIAGKTINQFNQYNF